MHTELSVKLAELEQKVTSYDGPIRELFEAIRPAVSRPISPGRRIGSDSRRNPEHPAGRKGITDELHDPTR
ncbi:MAG: hypothetical protein E8D45_02995 [Nitrospira sp.]|nr:MAG: hypothetical protein E8D45_02995 [Nitrospira sp.]